MRRIVCYAMLALLLVSCGEEGGRFRLEGRLRNLNQGEFYVYSPDGAMVGFDTIKVRDGRFAYERELREKSTLIIVFPNYSEQPVFAAPGKKATIKGDATHLKEMTIKGTEENDQLTALRLRLNGLLPPEVPKAVAEYIEKNPESIVSKYLLEHYFVTAPQPDYTQAARLADVMIKANPEDGRLLILKKQVEGLSHSVMNAKLPAFSTTDMNGKKVTQAQLKGKVNVLSVWASWNYQSTDIQRRLRKLRKTYGQQLAVVSICVDGRVEECRRRVVRDSLDWPVICDGRMFQTSIMQQLGLTAVPTMLIIDGKGKIVARNVQPAKLEEEIEKRLK